MIAFGPVPSRRLGRSLGINNIPAKTCTYSCVYCQLGLTPKVRVQRSAFYAPEDILREVEAKLEDTYRTGESVDYLTFVPDGEPTLDIHLRQAVELLKPLGIRIAVISNASLIWRLDVRDDLLQADWVSFKIDTTREAVRRRINRPHQELHMGTVLGGMLDFAANYGGTLVTETMLVEDINDRDYYLTEVADFLARLKPATAYLSIPTRPPAEGWVRRPSEDLINRAYQIMSKSLPKVEYLIGYEGNAFAATGDAEQDLLSITAVHPMREDAVDAFLERADADWAIIHKLIAEDQLIETAYEGKRFYLRRLPGHQ
ncbi:MAG: radical SAM protein [Candidatus Neomarinimicrobiota bacterium]